MLTGMGRMMIAVKPPCQIADCGRTSFARGHCHTHYYRLRKGLDMHAPVYDKSTETFEDRFWRNVVETDHGLMWTGAVSGKYKKYGSFTYQGVRWWAHRAAWVIQNGSIPDGLHIDHNPECPGACVTVAHLRVLTPSEHMQVGWARGEYQGVLRRGQCEVDGCDRPHDHHGYCRMHARRLERTGSPLGRSGTV